MTTNFILSFNICLFVEKTLMVTHMENIYLVAIGSGFAFGMILGRFITKLKLALIYEWRLKKRRADKGVCVR